MFGLESNKVFNFVFTIVCVLLIFIGIITTYGYYFGTPLTGCGIKDICYPNKTIVVPCEGKTSIGVTCIICANPDTNRVVVN